MYYPGTFLTIKDDMTLTMRIVGQDRGSSRLFKIVDNRVFSINDYPLVYDDGYYSEKYLYFTNILVLFMT